ncbi:MAG: EAL domain-containing protein [Lachnospiraceae bacterium]|nr:EAL domain-containing protein [Lachnospiraceae bacterium]
MWSYSFEVPILMILGIILSFYFSRPRLPIRRNRVFLQIVIAETLTIIIDVLATKACNEYSEYPLLWVDIINMLYFIAFFLRSYFFYLFSVSVLRITLGNKRLFSLLIRVPLIVGIVIAVHSMIFGDSGTRTYIYYVDAEGYHSGSMYCLVYFIGFFYVLMSFLCSYLFRNSFGRRREKYGMFSYNVLLLAGLIMRVCMPKYLIMDTFMFMAILVVFLAFINPEYFLDLRAVAFNIVALREYLEENKEKIYLIPMGLAVRSYQEMCDIYGSVQMEEGLALMGKYLKQTFKKGIVFYCRNGRFIILAPPETDFVSGRGAITERFESPWKSMNVELYLTVGYAAFDIPSGKYSSETFLNTMIRALDIAGSADSGEFISYGEEELVKTEKEKNIKKCIEAAIDKDGFELYLQPIVDAATGRVTGAEALSRIKDQDGSIIPPGHFIPVAEGSGRINALGEIVFDRTCKFIRENGLEKMGIEWINVNLSPAQFIRSDLAERYAAIAEKYGIDPGSVHLEITEGAMVDDVFLQKQINAMTEKGFKFVLDDYGTGYSNLSRLNKCPFINVKLDMSIVWGFCKEPDAILPGMIEAFRHMGFGITAEGIENADMAGIMTQIGCDLLQGYHYSKPLPAAEFAEKYSAR